MIPHHKRAQQAPRAFRLSAASLAISCAFSPLITIAEESAQLDPIDVNASRKVEDSSGFVTDSAIIGPLGKKKLIDIPYSVNVITSELIRNQQATSLTDLMKYLPSTQMEARGGMDVGRPQSRGMRGDVVANNHLDGLNIVSTTAFPMEMLERVEVINSLTGALYGPASPAGNFNYVQKRPTKEFLNNVTVGYRSSDAYTFHADLGGQLGDNGVVGYRVNLLSEEGRNFVKHSDLDRKLASIALDFKLTPDTVLELNASHYKFDKFGFPGSFAYSITQKLPDAPDASRAGYGQPFTGMALETNTFSARLRHDFSQDWNLTASVGRQTADRYLATATNTLQGNNGAYRTTTSSSVAGRFIVESNQASLNGKVHTGNIQHDLVFSTTGYNWEIYSARNNASYVLGNASFDNPQIYAYQDFLDSGSRYYAGKTRVQTYTVGDTITFNPQWALMLVGSYSDLQSDSYNAAGTRTADYDKGGKSGTVALTFKPLPNLSTYIAYADTLQEGAVAGNLTANPNEVLSPYRSKQYELGTKYTIGAINAGAALFQIERPFAFTGTDNVFKVQGEQRNRGLELTLNGELNSRWAVFSGVTFMNAKLENTANASTEGKLMVGVPKIQASVLAEYRVLEVPGLTLTGTLRHTGERAINTINTAYVDAYNVLDLGVRYVNKIQGKSTTWRLAVNNVTNERYWVSIFPGNIDGGVAAGSAFIGDPRELRASVTMAF